MWWRDGVLYQIYPRSFKDTNKDGIGDLCGIREKLSYLKWLGIKGFWLSPFYPSPMKDFGYDISNFTDVDPMFGTLEDFDDLVTEAKKLDLKLIVDFIPNHSSDEHPWFLDSKSSRQSTKRDWYIWRDPKSDGSPPNNWQSRFGGESSWTLDEASGQYYLHTFLKEQPDLNWRNKDVQTAMHKVMRFWLDRGVDGFRVDASFYCLKDPSLRDNPVNKKWTEGKDPSERLSETYSKNDPDIHAFNRALRNVTDEYPDTALIGELYLTFDKLIRHYGSGDEFHFPFNFSLTDAEWDGNAIADLIRGYEKELPPDACPNWVLGNHDQPRTATRIGSAQVKNSILLLMTLRGTPTMYYGEELGFKGVEIPEELKQDPQDKLSNGAKFGRDSSRTPMLWTEEKFAGFSETEPWLPLPPRHSELTVDFQQNKSDSILLFTHRLILLRNTNEVLKTGTIQIVFSSPQLLMYARVLDKARVLVVLNLSDAEQTTTLNPDFVTSAVMFEDLGAKIQFASGTIKCPAHHGAILTLV